MASTWKLVFSLGGFLGMVGYAGSDSQDDLFRALWIPTVENAMWPSDARLPSAQQRRELVDILNAARLAGVRAVFLQVRSEADAFYRSTLEPWSEYLAGERGRPPDGDWDPLGFLVEEARARGMAVHAWLNLFRAGVSAGDREPATHVCGALRAACHRYGGQLWLDPGSHHVRRHTMDVVTDIVRRYDIAGVHIDDFYYPTPVAGVEFPDDRTYGEYVRAGGTLDKPAWRRHSVTHFLSRLQKTIKAIKPSVRFSLDTLGLYSESDDMSLAEEASYHGYYKTPDSPKWPASHGVVGDFLTPRLSWRLEEAVDDDMRHVGPALQDWRLWEDPKMSRLYAGDPRYRILNPKWDVFTLCGREDCHIKHHRPKRATDEDLEEEVRFEVFLHSDGLAQPVVSGASDGIDEVVVTVVPEILETKPESPYNITWNPSLTEEAIYIIVHGYLSGPDRSWVKKIREALMNRNEANGVIVADWASIAGSKWYPKSRGRIAVVAGQIGQLVQDLVKGGHTGLERVHCIGHSLGAHTCGLAAKNAPFGRITGLDPAGPEFDVDVPSTRLDRADGSFVDVIHTDVGLGETNLGFEEAIGDLDFYPNGFRIKQPGCYTPGCSHKRAHKYYTESILNDCFTVYYKCNTTDIPGTCGERADGKPYTRMGHYAPKYDAKEGIFYLRTTRFSPYCAGCNGLNAVHTVLLTFLCVNTIVIYLKKY